jgi:hypothetical protein
LLSGACVVPQPTFLLQTSKAFDDEIPANICNSIAQKHDPIYLFRANDFSRSGIRYTRLRSM